MIISKTPLRIGFVGGGTDIDAFYSTGYGAVVSATINKYIYVTVHKRFDSSIRVSYTKTEVVDRVEDLQHDIVKACLQMVGIKEGIEITTIGEVPAGTGLGSSSSLTVGLLNALYAYKGVTLSAKNLMERASEVEIGILRSPIGKQDQCAAAFGGMNYFRFEADETVNRQQLVLPELTCRTLERKLMMLYTGHQRSANGILASQKEKTPASMDTLIQMREQAEAMRKLLTGTEDFYEDFAAMLHDGWMKKRSITGEISNSAIDDLYDRARQAGAKGGKLLGAGGGGFLLLYCDEKDQSRVRQTLGLRELDFYFTRYGSRIVYFGS
ncbi:MAG: GHMP kinase [Eubacteriales bacterium]|nr:GHMP kinase [Eubacteriales bacterium]